MATRRNQLVLVALVGAALQGCSSTPRFNDHFGEAVRTNLSAQAIDPTAVANVNPAHGVDGPAALAGHEAYQRSFKEPDARANQPMISTHGSR
jgi:type IV pilus biogenesis protein CpaD/CtpE